MEKHQYSEEKMWKMQEKRRYGERKSHAGDDKKVVRQAWIW